MSKAKKSSLAGISSRNRKDVEIQKPTPRSVSLESKPIDISNKKIHPIQYISAQAAALIKDKLEGKETPENQKEDRKEVEFDSSNSPLPKIDMYPDAADVRKALFNVLNMFDTLYFGSKGINICVKMVERECLLNCQHYSYCRSKIAFKESIKEI